jgi:hypothetical protein
LVTIVKEKLLRLSLWFIATGAKVAMTTPPSAVERSRIPFATNFAQPWM